MNAFAFYRFELGRLLRNRLTVTGAALFAATLAWGTYHARRGSIGLEDRGYGAAYLLASCVLLHAHIGADRANQFVEFAITNLVRPVEYVAAKILACATLLLGFSAVTFVLAIPAFDFDLTHTAWYATRMTTALWLFFPGILAVEVIAGVRVPQAVFLVLSIITLMAVSTMTQLDLAQSLGLDPRDRSFAGIRRTFLLGVTVVPVALVLIGAVWTAVLARAERR